MGSLWRRIPSLVRQRDARRSDPQREQEKGDFFPLAASEKAINARKMMDAP